MFDIYIPDASKLRSAVGHAKNASMKAVKLSCNRKGVFMRSSTQDNDMFLNAIISSALISAMDCNRESIYVSTLDLFKLIQVIRKNPLGFRYQRNSRFVNISSKKEGVHKQIVILIQDKPLYAQTVSTLDASKYLEVKLDMLSR